MGNGRGQCGSIGGIVRSFGCFSPAISTIVSGAPLDLSDLRGLPVQSSSIICRIFRKAIPRWLRGCFSVDVISPKVRECPAGTNRGSYPNPPDPRGAKAMVPSQAPVAENHLVGVMTSTTVHRNRAVRCDTSNLSRDFRRRRLFAALSAGIPAKRALRTPGRPPRKSTSRP